MDIGLFQLENLFVTHTRFCFLDLRRAVAASAPFPAELDKILSQARQVGADDVKKYLLETKVAQDAPIILVCENGRGSRTVADRLEGEGYRNVYVVERGVEGLLSEL